MNSNVDKIDKKNKKISQTIPINNKDKNLKKLRSLITKYKHKSTEFSHNSIDKTILNSLFSIKGDNTDPYNIKNDLTTE